MNVRSRGLLLVAVALLASAGGLAALLVHDGDSPQPVALTQAQPGDEVEVRGQPEEFAPAPPLRDWRHILPLLGNATYSLDVDGVAVLLTGEAAPPAGTAVAHGDVLWVGPHPSDPARLLVLVQVHEWREAILLR